MQRLTYQAELELFEVAQAAVEHFRAAARRARGEVTRLDQRHLQPTGGRVQGGAGAHHAAADHHDVELLGSQPLPCDHPFMRVKERLPSAGGGLNLDHT